MFKVFIKDKWSRNYFNTFLEVFILSLIIIGSFKIILTEKNPTFSEIGVRTCEIVLEANKLRDVASLESEVL